MWYPKQLVSAHTSVGLQYLLGGAPLSFAVYTLFGVRHLLSEDRWVGGLGGQHALLSYGSLPTFSPGMNKQYHERS